MQANTLLANPPRTIAGPATPFQVSQYRYYTTIIKTKRAPSDYYTCLNLLILPKNQPSPYLTIIPGPIAQYTQSDITIPFAPDDIESIIITPQSGTWELDEFILKPQSHPQQLLFRNLYHTESPYLEPLIPFKPLGPEVKAQYELEYQQLKDNIITTAIKTTTLGTFASFFLASPERSLAYSIGGTLGILYATLLQRSIDRIGPSPSTTPFIDTLARQLAIAIIAASALSHYETAISTDRSLFFFALAGFFASRAGYF